MPRTERLLAVTKKLVTKTNRKDEMIMKYICPCGYEYDPVVGDPDNGIAPGTAWEDVPEDFLCPICGLGKEVFEEA